MYNLLVTAKDGAWEESSYLWERGRFLEYTDEKIMESHESLSDEVIQQLMNYPCLFMYEGTKHVARVGKITRIVLRGRTSVFIDFEIFELLRPIEFSEIKPLRQKLDIREWELNRTHWAIKDEDLLDRLNPILSDEIHRLAAEFETPTSLEPETRDQPTICSVEDYIRHVISNSASSREEVFYRGHSSKKYRLEPSLFRRDKKGNYRFLEKEHILYRELLVSNSTDFQDDNSTLDRLVRMQHYSLPTRLLDLTSNPLIALYFACIENPKKRGEVISFKVKRKNVRYFDSDRVSCISNLARLPWKEKGKIDFSVSISKKNFNAQMAVKRLLHFIKEEKPYFEPRIKKSHLSKIECVKGKRNNDRMVSQSGAFLVFGLDAVLNEQGTNNIGIGRVTIKDKSKILKELDHLNINESTVFPYIESSAKYIAKQKW